ncbi:MULTISPECIES: hypothetical protein [unclassified Mesorhizobium]|uniref:ABC transporter ATP-binding protein n=1 Tax=unclassified Mesorhizobium TaxID=325217 RepID=UPI0033388BE6
MDVEQGEKEEIFQPPHHSYTELLLASAPQMDPDWLTRTLSKTVALAEDPLAPVSITASLGITATSTAHASASDGVISARPGDKFAVCTADIVSLSLVISVS